MHLSWVFIYLLLVGAIISILCEVLFFFKRTNLYKIFHAHNIIPWTRIFSPVKYFACKFFTQSKFHHQTLVTKIGIGRRTLHKIFRVFNFRWNWSSTKIFNNKSFVIYGNTNVTLWCICIIIFHLQGCPSWKWFYPYHYARFASDFKNITRVHNNFD